MSFIRKSNSLGLILIGWALLLASASAHGAGVAIIEQSAAAAGYAYAGVAAVAQDASTLSFNPAGMTKLTGHELQIGGHYIVLGSQFENQGSTTLLGTRLSGPDSDGGVSALVPNVYYVHSFSDRWKAGIGITTPYGLASEYDDGWVGRYHALRSEMQTLNINPAIAYRISDKWSLGVGINIQQAKVEMTAAIDYGTILAILNNDPSTSQTLDGKSSIEGEAWSYGANIGLLFEPREGSRLGLHYRSAVDYDVDGDVTFETPDDAAEIAQSLGLVNTTAKTEMTMPESVSFSGYHAFSETWAVLADVTWTRWSHWEELRISLGSGAPDNVTTLKWEDIFRVSLGVLCKPMDSLELRTGIAYDESPVPSPQYRSPRVPDADRIWFCLGVGYRFSKWITADFAYSHIFIDNPKIDKDITEDENRIRGALVGEYDSSIDIVSAALSFHF
jgi:long-chain fatty acid transport protein